MTTQHRGQEPTEEPTTTRLQEARAQGLIAHSPLLTALGALIAATVVLAFALRTWTQDLTRFARRCFALSGTNYEPPGALVKEGLSFLWNITLSVGLAVFLGALLLGLLQTRGLFTVSPLKPNWSRLQLLPGLRRVFSSARLVEIATSGGFILVMVILCVVTIQDHAADLAALAQSHPRSILEFLSSAGTSLLLKGLAVLACAAVVDAFLSYLRLRKSLRMTRQEIRQELREGENAGLTARARRPYGDTHASRNIQNATLVVADPSNRSAIALVYQPASHPAPLILANGKNLHAERVLAIARQYGIPIFPDAELACALNDVKIGSFIPEPLYERVAECVAAAATGPNSAPSLGLGLPQPMRS